MSFRRDLQIFVRDFEEIVNNTNKHIEYFSQLLEKHPRLKKKARDISSSVEEILSKLGEIFSSCKSCLNCEDCCCITSSPSIYFYNCETLYLASIGKKLSITSSFIEEAKRRKRLVCGFYSNKGCTLPRTIRPIVCVSYLCDKLRIELSTMGRLNEVKEFIKILNRLDLELYNISSKLIKAERFK